jgi:DNA-binding MarR family transcriptional regulator
VNEPLVSQEVTKRSRSAGEAGEKPVDEVAVWRSIADSWRRLQRAAEKNLAALDLSPHAELRILKLLREQGSTPMHRFCQETMLSQPSITGIIDKLEDRGLVERVRSKEDRREVLIAITPKGERAYLEGKDLHRQFVERALSSLKPAEVNELVVLFKKFADASDAQA